jgi:hypothetical protein
MPLHAHTCRLSAPSCDTPATAQAHTWLRLLLGAHNPGEALGLVLDGWERPRHRRHTQPQVPTATHTRQCGHAARAWVGLLMRAPTSNGRLLLVTTTTQAQGCVSVSHLHIRMQLLEAHLADWLAADLQHTHKHKHKHSTAQGADTRRWQRVFCCWVRVDAKGWTAAGAGAASCPPPPTHTHIQARQQRAPPDNSKNAQTSHRTSSLSSL